jgi:hypothetical protein
MLFLVVINVMHVRLLVALKVKMETYIQLTICIGMLRLNKRTAVAVGHTRNS